VHRDGRAWACASSVTPASKVDVRESERERREEREEERGRWSQGETSTHSARAGERARER